MVGLGGYQVEVSWFFFQDASREWSLKAWTGRYSKCSGHWPCRNSSSKKPCFGWKHEPCLHFFLRILLRFLSCLQLHQLHHFAWKVWCFDHFLLRCLLYFRGCPGWKTPWCLTQGGNFGTKSKLKPPTPSGGMLFTHHTTPQKKNRGKPRKRIFQGLTIQQKSFAQKNIRKQATPCRLCHPDVQLTWETCSPSAWKELQDLS